MSEVDNLERAKIYYKLLDLSKHLKMWANMFRKGEAFGNVSLNPNCLTIAATPDRLNFGANASPYSYARISRTVSREALNAGKKLASADKIVTMINHATTPSNEIE